MGDRHGFLNLLKPPGMTSHDVVAQCRRLLNQSRIGHTGTLDPGAAGVLVVACGRATRLARYLLESVKAYRAEVRLGVATDTQDASGTVIGRGDTSGVTAEELAHILARRRGPGTQVPPMVSAVKQQGVPLHRLARRGEEVARKPRPVVFHRLELLEYRREGDRAVARLDVECSAGTYVRALCADVGDDLGVGGHLAFLVRTASGPFTLDDSVTLEELAAGPELWLIDPGEGVRHFPAVEVEGRDRDRVLHGNPVPALAGPTGTVRVMAGGRLLAMAEAIDDGPGRRLLPRVVVAEVGGL